MNLLKTKVVDGVLDIVAFYDAFRPYVITRESTGPLSEDENVRSTRLLSKLFGMFDRYIVYYEMTS